MLRLGGNCSLVRSTRLGLDGAMDRINGATEFRHTVASRIGDPAAMRRDQAAQNLSAR
jgi:hypothetical protein